MRHRGIYRLFAIGILMVQLTACKSTQVKEKTLEEYDYGVIATSIQEEGTEVILLDSEFDVTSKEQCEYGSIGGNSYRYPIIKDDTLYEISLGNGYDKNDCGIVKMNLNTKEFESIPVDRVNITDLVVSDEYLYTVSNLNRTTYIDRYPIKDGEQESYILEDSIGLDLCLWENQLFVFIGEVDSYMMYHVDFNTMTHNKIFDLTEYCMEDNEPCFYACYEDYIYLPCNQNLLQLDMKNQSIQVIELTRDGAFGLYQIEDKFYIACGNRFNPADDTYILEYDARNQVFTNEYEINHGVMQFVLDNELLVILGMDDNLYEYELSDSGECSLKRQSVLEHGENQYIAALFLNK